MKTVSRRTFLRAGAIALPLILPARIFGQNAPSKRVTVGMIGCGRWGSKTNLDPFLKMADVSVVAVCDVDAKHPHWHSVLKKWVYYAPQYRTDREWYDNTVFPPESGFKDSCESRNPSWPLGEDGSVTLA